MGRSMAGPVRRGCRSGVAGAGAGPGRPPRRRGRARRHGVGLRSPSRCSRSVDPAPGGRRLRGRVRRTGAVVAVLPSSRASCAARTPAEASSRSRPTSTPLLVVCGLDRPVKVRPDPAIRRPRVGRRRGAGRRADEVRPDRTDAGAIGRRGRRGSTPGRRRRPGRRRSTGRGARRGAGPSPRAGRSCSWASPVPASPPSPTPWSARRSRRRRRCGRATPRAGTRPPPGSSTRSPAAACSSTRPGIRAVGLWVDPDAVSRQLRRHRGARRGRAASPTAPTTPSPAARSAPRSRRATLAPARLEAWAALQREAAAAARRADPHERHAYERRFGRMVKDAAKRKRP